MNNKEYIESVEKKLDQLNANSLKANSIMPFSINRHLNILGGLKNDNMEA